MCSYNELYFFISEVADEIKKQNDVMSVMKDDIDEVKATVYKIKDELDSLISDVVSGISVLRKSYSFEYTSKEDQENSYAHFIKEANDMILSSMVTCTTSLDSARNELSGDFGEYWRHLNEYTQTSLASARLMFNFCNKPQFEGMDYSGVVKSHSFNAVLKVVWNYLFLGNSRNR